MKSFLKGFALPLVFLGALLFSLFCGASVPYAVKSFLYAVSVLIKSLLIFALPFVIFSLVFSSITKIGKRAFKYILVIVPMICCSNFFNTIMSYLVSFSFKEMNLSGQASGSDSVQVLKPSFELAINNLLSNDIALLSGVILGIVFVVANYGYAKKISGIFDKFTKYFFKVLIPIMPLFIIGTALKLQHEGMLTTIFEKYFPIMIIFIGSAYSFVLIEYFVLSKFRVSKFVQYLGNVFPAVVTAFGSMSSAAALPISIKAAEKNLDVPENSNIIIPSTVNIHLVGDCFFIPMIAIAVLFSFGQDSIPFSQYILFALHFVLAKFAVAAVPGGGALVMLPVMQQFLGLNSDMLALVTALYVLFDPFITACNVAGNGAFAILFDKITSVLFRSKPKTDKAL